MEQRQELGSDLHTVFRGVYSKDWCTLRIYSVVERSLQ